jgi:hypothetical protein
VSGPIYRLVAAWLLTVAFASQSTKEPEASVNLEKLLGDDIFQSSGMAKLFEEGSPAVPQLVVLLKSQDQSVSDNAQLMLRTARGIEALQEWYLQPRPVLRMVNGPVPSPLTDWDYKHIESAILSRPYQEWKAEAVNYLMALFVDASPRADQMLKRMLDEIPEDGLTAVSDLADRIRKNSSRPDRCLSGMVEKEIVEGAFFLSPAEKKRTEVKVVAYDEEHRRALVMVSQSFGRTFLVVFSRTESCWGYQSISLYSTNN